LDENSAVFVGYIPDRGWRTTQPCLIQLIFKLQISQKL